MRTANTKKMMNTCLLIPTYNAGARWREVLESIRMQSYLFHKKIMVDSGSTDDTVSIAQEYGFEVIRIRQEEFNHGSTRQKLVDYASGADIALFLTQDAILADKMSVSNLVSSFKIPSVAMAYGRQLPHQNAGILEAHARLYNYPSQSYIRSMSDRAQFGFKTIFCSNSFAAYRIATLNGIGGFPVDSIMGEDTITAAKLLFQNFQIAYVSDATVYHSHHYTFMEDFKRFFDTRVFHEQNKWLMRDFGRPTGEGVKYVVSEIRYVFRRKPVMMFKVFTSVLAKWLGYNLGRFYKMMSLTILKKVSMHRFYWR